MNLTELFKEQQLLRDKIGYNEPDRFEKLILALLVELGECANCWRGFKFWSKRQEPLKEIVLNSPSGGTKTVYPLLEEYVDGLHFVLELGIEKGFMPRPIPYSKETSITNSFITVMEFATLFELSPTSQRYNLLFTRFIELGEILGFTWEQIEQAYMEKNAINHERQEQGY